MKTDTALLAALALALSTAVAAQAPADQPEDAPTGPPASAAPDGPYMSTCKDPMVKDGVLYATCQKPDKTRRQAKLQMPCAGRIENKAGTLVCTK